MYPYTGIQEQIISGARPKKVHHPSSPASRPSHPSRPARFSEVARIIGHGFMIRAKRAKKCVLALQN